MVEEKTRIVIKQKEEKDKEEARYSNKTKIRG